MALEFTAGMLMRAMDRRSRSDQIDRHIISLATGITYADLGKMPRRKTGPYHNDLVSEVIPEQIRVKWDDSAEQWAATLCSCTCECDECLLVIECGDCECAGHEIIRFREPLENDFERVNHTAKPGGGFNTPRLVEIVTSADDMRSWRLKRYKTIEMAVVWSLGAPFPEESL